eukprot:scaffold2550_cov22-Prasinocladus_malaysianus.AAC.1
MAKPINSAAMGRHHLPLPCLPSRRGSRQLSLALRPDRPRQTSPGPPVTPHPRLRSPAAAWTVTHRQPSQCGKSSQKQNLIPLLPMATRQLLFRFSFDISIMIKGGIINV